MTQHQNTIVTSEDCLVYARMSPEAAKGIILLAMATLTDAFNSLVGYSILEKEYKDVRVHGSDRELLMLPARNVTAVSSVAYLSGRSGDRFIWSTLAADLWDIDAVTRLGVVGIGGFTFASGAGNWQVSFTAGWKAGDVPGAIRERMFYEVKRFCEARVDVASANMGGQSSKGESYLDISTDTRRVLAGYARIGI